MCRWFILGSHQNIGKYEKRQRDTGVSLVWCPMAELLPPTPEVENTIVSQIRRYLMSFLCDIMKGKGIEEVRKTDTKNASYREAVFNERLNNQTLRYVRMLGREMDWITSCPRGGTQVNTIRTVKCEPRG